MNSKQKLTKAVEYLINEESDKAADLLKAYIIETAAAIHQRIVEDEEDIMEMDREVEHDDMGDDLADEIADDKSEIKSEEMFGEDHDEHEDHEMAGEEDALDLDADMDVDVEDHEMTGEEDMDIEDIENELDDLHTRFDDFESEFEELSAEFDKIKDDEEIEHDKDYDENGVVGNGEEPEDVFGHDSEELEDVDGDVDYEDSIEESVELHKISVNDKKDKSPNGSQKGAVPEPKDRLPRLGGEPVKNNGPDYKGGYERQTMKVKEVTKNSNVVNSGKEALTKTTNVKTKDQAPHAGESPAMPKGKK